MSLPEELLVKAKSCFVESNAHSFARFSSYDGPLFLQFSFVTHDFDNSEDAGCVFTCHLHVHARRIKVYAVEVTHRPPLVHR